MATKSILVLHGPNLNLLGEREPQHYGKQTLEDIDQVLKTIASAKAIKLETMQSNSEGDLVNKIQSLHKDKIDFLIINPAAYTHTSVAMRDALSAVKVPFIEVHLSNVYAREPFRHHSYFSDIAVAVISGLGADGYIAALNFAINA
ncbi:type II 3-dehydroquinate dehydratase [Candidatus Methylopumilus rimovensis]|jgi:3-dehydroquinate dehydratase-2|uniref:3-dehydroquinate dehydratase n=1 Tax=Candidatus Methylopumilus rimovensis TaxID=2588535 RepID=A0AAE6FRY6_9PROT|nr:type II 3-dehydroquinate dehydratase [Candidatus Methylopumilus rimovensis]QDD11580.1 type II 3-dehydroquinate dehydratase [Candidatus Methylopumilus rimovensis]QDD12895.1 type II 3-dehydroquinate dehydratase [Candidatus Methylopumilus rimovensis]